jgi:hypothetical protein
VEYTKEYTSSRRGKCPPRRRNWDAMMLVFVKISNGLGKSRSL